jgi:hypothetical protein
MDRDVDFVKMVFTAEPPVFNVTKQKQHLEVPPFARQPCYRILAEDLGQWLCVPPFRMVCLFRAHSRCVSCFQKALMTLLLPLYKQIGCHLKMVIIINKI